MNKIIKNTLILTAITVVSGLLLGLVYDITKKPIAIAQENTRQEAFQFFLTRPLLRSTGSMTQKKRENCSGKTVMIPMRSQTLSPGRTEAAGLWGM